MDFCFDIWLCFFDCRRLRFVCFVILGLILGVYFDLGFVILWYLEFCRASKWFGCVLVLVWWLLGNFWV